MGRLPDYFFKIIALASCFQRLSKIRHSNIDLQNRVLKLVCILRAITTRSHCRCHNTHTYSTYAGTLCKTGGNLTEPKGISFGRVHASELMRSGYRKAADTMILKAPVVFLQE